MLFLILFCSGSLLLVGLLSILDTVIWKIEAGQQFIEFGIRYAVMRHQFYFQELTVGIVAVFLGTAVITMSLCSIKKCSCCGKHVSRKQNFCHSCGNEIVKKVS